MGEKLSTITSLVLSSSLIFFLWLMDIQARDEPEKSSKSKERGAVTVRMDKFQNAPSVTPIKLPAPPQSQKKRSQPPENSGGKETSQKKIHRQPLTPTKPDKELTLDPEKILVPDNKNLLPQPTERSRTGVGMPNKMRDFPSETKTQPGTRPRHKKQLVKVDHLNRKSLAQGRALLRILEHGSGPNIDIAWPDGARARNKLFSAMLNCYGLKVLLADNQNRLYGPEGSPERPTVPDLDKTSGLARQVDGVISKKEMLLLRKIRSRHSGIGPTRPVRLFPRKFDGRLLAGISKLYNGNTNKIRTLKARYQLSGSELRIEDVRINGKDFSGIIDLTPTSSCRNS